jgi:hypothetical protein
VSQLCFPISDQLISDDYQYSFTDLAQPVQSVASVLSTSTGQGTTAGTQTGSGTTRPRDTWARARDVRTQAINAPHPSRNAGRYPASYSDYPNQGTQLTLQTQRPHLHHPINPFGPNSWDNTTHPGAARIFYNDNDRTIIDVGYHSPKQPSAGRFHEFINASYHPAAVHPASISSAVMPPADGSSMASPPAAASPPSANIPSDIGYQSSSSGGYADDSSVDEDVSVTAADWSRMEDDTSYRWG